MTTRTELEHQLLVTARRILEASYLRVICRMSGKKPADLAQEDQDAALEQWQGAITHDLELFREVIRQGWIGAVEEVQTNLHATVLDHEMVDQAIEYAGRPDGPPVKL